MQSFLILLRRTGSLFLFLLSYLLLIPAVPSKKIEPQRLRIMNRATLVSLVVFFVSLVLFWERYRVLKFCRNSKTLLFILAYSLCFLLHLVIRHWAWYSYLSTTYGEYMYNVFFHSAVYAFLMSGVFCTTVILWTLAIFRDAKLTKKKPTNR